MNEKEIVELIKKHLKVEIDTDSNVYTDKQIIIVSILWDGKEIDSDKVTIQ